MSETPAAGDKDDEVRDEVRLDLDEDTLDTWEDVRGDYAVDPESEVARPAVTEDDDAEAEGEADEDEDRPSTRDQED